MGQGKGILQPHHLIDELDNIISNETACQKLRDGPFSEVLKSAQVILFFYFFWRKFKFIFWDFGYLILRITLFIFLHLYVT